MLYCARLWYTMEVTVTSSPNVRVRRFLTNGLSGQLGLLALDRYETEHDFSGLGPHDRHVPAHTLPPNLMYGPFKVGFKVQHLFPIQNPKRIQGTLIKTARNRLVSRNQTIILAGTLKSTLKEANLINHIQIVGLSSEWSCSLQANTSPQADTPSTLKKVKQISD